MTSGFQAEPDWAAFRAEFPALEEQVLLNTAGGAPLSRLAAAEGARYFEEMLAAGDAFWPNWQTRIDGVRAKVATLLNAEADDVAFLSSASAAMNAVTAYLDPSDSIVTVAEEFPSVTTPWINRGHQVTAIPLDGRMGASLDAITAAVTPQTGAIVISHVQYRNGRRYDLAALAEIAEAANALLIVDATQSFGAIPIDVQTERISILMASGYKWPCAGYGIGAVYLSPEVRKRPPPVYGWRSAVVPYALDPMTIDPTETAVQLEMGHPPLAPAFCLGGALDHLSTVGVEAVWSRIQVLGQYLANALDRKGLPAPFAPAGESGIAVLSCPEAAAIKQRLADQKIYVTASGPYLRLSVHAYVTEDDIDRGVAALAEAWTRA